MPVAPNYIREAAKKALEARENVAPINSELSKAE